MTLVLVSWIDAEPSEHTSVDEALNMLADHGGEIRVAVIMAGVNIITFTGTQMARFLEQRTADIELERRHERSPQKWS